MKKVCLTALLAIGVAHLASAQDAAFGGLEKIMDHDTYERAGLGKLTSDERAVLDGFIRDYVAGKQKDAAAVAATEAVDRAVKERKVRSPGGDRKQHCRHFQGLRAKNGFSPRKRGIVEAYKRGHSCTFGDRKSQSDYLSGYIWI